MTILTLEDVAVCWPISSNDFVPARQALVEFFGDSKPTVTVGDDNTLTIEGYNGGELKLSIPADGWRRQLS